MKLRKGWDGNLTIAAVATPQNAAAAPQDADKPNVVLMLADNVGWGDIGAFGGGEIRGMPTPDQRSSGLSGRQVGDRSLRRRDHGARPE